jgi:hypothetical protein
MSAQLRPIGIIAFASALLAFGVPTNIAFAVDCLTAPNSPAPPNSHWYYRTDRTQEHKCWHLQTDNGQSELGRKSISVGTYKRITVSQNRESCRLRAKRQPNPRNLLRRVVPMQVRVSRTSWRSTEAPNYQKRTLKHFMQSSWNGDGAIGIRIDRQLRSKLRLTKRQVGRVTADVAFVAQSRHPDCLGECLLSGGKADIEI